MTLPNLDDCSIYIFVRQDIPLAQQLVQSMHALLMMAWPPMPSCTMASSALVGLGTFVSASLLSRCLPVAAYCRDSSRTSPFRMKSRCEHFRPSLPLRRGPQWSQEVNQMRVFWEQTGILLPIYRLGERVRRSRHRQQTEPHRNQSPKLHDVAVAFSEADHSKPIWFACFWFPVVTLTTNTAQAFSKVQHSIVCEC